jgi:hypothetical protein
LLDGVVAKLRRGAAVADVDCGHGASRVIMAQVDEAKLRAVFEEAGFTRFRRAHLTPFNLILDAKK